VHKSSQKGHENQDWIYAQCILLIALYPHLQTNETTQNFSIFINNFNASMSNTPLADVLQTFRKERKKITL